MTAVLAIDPGLTGALAFYDGSELQISDMPVFTLKKTTVDHLGLARLIDMWTGGKSVQVWLEAVSASPQMGVTSAFRFGETYGLIRGVLAANFLNVNLVTPAMWKRAMKVSANKDACRAEACRRFPRESALFARKRDHGRAEAALIALYGSKTSERA